jgi:hypothetical protein
MKFIQTIFELDVLLSHSVHGSFVLFEILLQFHVASARNLGFLHSAFYFLHKLRKLSVLFILRLKSIDNFGVLLLHLMDH